MEKILHRILFNAANRKDLLERMQRQTTAMLIIGGIALLIMIIGFSTGSWPLPLIVLLCLAALGVFFWLGREKPSDFDPAPIARTIEREHPDLRALLITAVEQKADASGEMNYLQHKVIESTLEEAQRQKWVNFVDESEIRSAKFKRMVWTLLAWVCVVVLGFFGFRGAFSGAASILPPIDIDVPSFIKHAHEVTPGDVEIEKGNRLPVSIKFNANVPTKVDLLIGPDLENLRSIPTVKNLEDPVFGAVIPEVNESSVYKLSFGEGETSVFKISVFEFPRLESANATITPPDYTGLEGKTLKDVTFVNAVEQSDVRFDMVLNKPVKEAKLVARGEDELEITLAADGQSPEIYVANLKATKTIDFDLHLIDSEGRENKSKDRITLNVLENAEPMVKIKFPGRDVDISPIEELHIEAETNDDFGLLRYGIAYDFKGDSQEIVIAEPKGKELEGKIAHMFSMEALEAEADDLFSYSVWAEDVGPDGEVRRVSSDMFFAEIRPFEKVYRESTGQSDQQQQQQGGGQGERLAKLQKDVINATWKVIRNHDKSEEELAKDLEAITEAQRQVALMIEEAMGQVQGDAVEFLKKAVEHIEKAVPELVKATEDKSVEPLDEALREERAAYAMLLKLRAREVQVRRGQQGQGGQQQGGADQDQINNMKLREEERRYETESEAEKQRLEQQRQQQQENSETQKYLERLKDLARRQEGLDDQIKDLQVALDMAETEEEKEEIMRQLKRLREEQRDLLRDLDEMREDLNAPERRELSDTRDELDKIRENVQETADALNQADTDSAATASTRARENLEELKDEIRERTGSQFKEQMRDMRQQARDLVEKQKEITSEIQEATESDSAGTDADRPRARQSLDGAGGEGTPAKINEQKERLEKLTDEMKRLTQESEIPEPLLSKKLYDALREVKPERLGERMDDTARDLDRGNPQSAQERNQATTEDVEKLAAAVEDAARSVLGNEREALELAQNEIQDLVDQVQRQQGLAGGEQPGNQPGQPGETGAPGGQQPGNQPAQPGQPGIPQPGGTLPGTPQPGATDPTQGLQPGVQPQQPGGQQPGAPQPGATDPTQGLQPGVQPQQPGGQQPGAPQPGATDPTQGLQPGVQPQQPGGQQPGGQQPGGQQPGGQQPGGQQPGGQQPGGQQPGGQQPGGQQPGGQQPGGQQPGGQQPGGQQPGGQQPGGQQPGGQQPGGQQPGGQQPGGQQPGGQQPGGQQPGGQQPGGQQPGGQQPGGQQPGGQQPGGQQPGGQQPGGQQPGGQQPGGQQPGGQQPGGQQPGGQQPGGQQPGGQQPGGQQPGGQQPGGQQPGGQQPGGQQPGGQQPGGQQPGGQGRGPRPTLDGADSQTRRGPGNTGGGGPDTGNQPARSPQTPDEAMRNWVEQLSDIQDILDDPEMRDSAGRVKDDVKDLIRDLKRDSKAPNQDTIKNYVLNPLGELNTRVEEELARLGDDNEKLVPIDKDPVPEAYSELVQKYYEELGKGN